MRVFIAIFCFLFFLSFFRVAQAKNIKDLRFSLTSSEIINQQCQRPEKQRPVTSCYLGTNPPHIIIRSDISTLLLPYVLASEIGYYFLDGSSTEIIKMLFGPGISSISSPTIKDYFNRAAGDFALWLMGSDVGKAKSDFFLSLVRN